MTEFTVDGLKIKSQDLSGISPEPDDDERMFHHSGESSISLDSGGSTDSAGFYIWNESSNGWYPAIASADKLDGKDSSDFVHRDGSLSMLADLDFGNYSATNVESVRNNSGILYLNANHAELHANSSGSSVRLKDNNGLLLLNAQEGGVVNAPDTLAESGNRVATRKWTNANADVPNADYADDAGTLDGLDSSAYLQVSGDQMTGILDLGGNDLKDGGTVKYDTSTGNFVQSALGGPASSLNAYPLANTDLANNSVTVNSGNQLTGGGSVNLGGSITLHVNEGAGSGLNADFLDGDHASDLVHVAGDTMSGRLKLATSATNDLFIAPTDSSDPSIGWNHPSGGTLKLQYSKNLHADAEHWLTFSDGNSSTVTDGVAMSYDNSDVLPMQDATGDLGKSSNRFRNLHLSGTGYIGGNQIATRSWTNTNFYDTAQADSNFVDASGDTMNGALKLRDSYLRFNSSGASYYGPVWESSGSDKWHLQYDSANNRMKFRESGVADRLILEPGGPVNTPEANLQERGNRVATRQWTNANADVPNADYADNANQLDGLDSTQFLRSDTQSSLTANLTVEGENYVQFGGGNYEVRYDSGRDVLVIGSAENGEVMEVDNAGNLSIEGSLTEGATIGS